jgi:hypothetical protein
MVLKKKKKETSHGVFFAQFRSAGIQIVISLMSNVL